jgi:hypothetical protein
VDVTASVTVLFLISHAPQPARSRSLSMPTRSVMSTSNRRPSTGLRWVLPKKDALSGDDLHDVRQMTHDVPALQFATRAPVDTPKDVIA